jgi:SAM-dependent methyltransferase
MSRGAPWFLPSHPRVYDDIGAQYALYRRPDPRIARQIAAALGNASTLCNIGAGTGAYEPSDRKVVAVEPAAQMLAQRTTPAIRAVAEALPFKDDAFDAAMSILSTHHWTGIDQGLSEMCRIARRRVLLVFDASTCASFWLVRDYVPEIGRLERSTPTVDRIAAAVRATRIEIVPVPFDCSDGFLAAYWRRPERYLESGVRECISGLAQLDPTLVHRSMAQLERDLASGAWHARHADLMTRDVMDWGYRLIIAEPT